MICPDVNLLLYAVNKAFPQHREAKTWWDQTLSGTVPVSLLHVVVLGFVRLSMNHRVFPTPLDADQVVGVVDSWLGQPNVQLLSPGESHWGVFKAMLQSGRATGHLTTAAHIAAMASEFGLTVYSNDADFARFPGISVANPLAAS